MGEYDISTSRDCVDTGGDLDCSDSPVDFSIVQKIVHENYDPFSVNQANDIALLRVDRPVQYTGIYFLFINFIYISHVVLRNGKNTIGMNMLLLG